MSQIKISVIMPTYNSERTIAESLESIRMQSIDQQEIEILVIDGGSTDRTREIAKEYQATVLENPKRLPEAAKEIGLLQARGEWGMFLDSDEMFANPDSFRRRLRLLESNTEVKNLVCTGVLCAKDAGGPDRYANAMGDPFSNFVYNHYNGFNRMESMKANFPHRGARKEERGVLFDFTQAAFLPLYDGQGNMFELSYARECYEKSDEKENFVSTIFDQMVSKTHVCAMLEDDFVFHKPNVTAAKYRSKLRWRVINNLFGSTAGIGFGARRKTNSYLRKRQYLFVLYSVTLVGPVYDSVRLAVKHHDAYFLAHFLWSEYVFLVICWYMARKIVNRPPKRTGIYGKR